MGRDQNGGSPGQCMMNPDIEKNDEPRH
jgi:hypothetical protein